MTRPTLHLGVIALFLSSLVAACDGPPHDDRADASTSIADAGTGDASEPDRSFLELCGGFERHCEHLYACALPERLAQEQALFGHHDLAECLAVLPMTLGGYCTLLDRSASEGRVSIDLPRLAQCRDAMEALACEAYLEASSSPPRECEGSPFATGLVPRGGACTWDQECSGSDVCSHNDGETEGTCGALPRRGEACFGDRCADELECIDEVCGGPPGTGCLEDRECGSDEYCDQPGNDWRVDHDGSGTRGECAPRRVAGESCEGRRACVDSCDLFSPTPGCLYCDDSGGFDDEGWRQPGLCVPVGETGAACTEAGGCLSRSCVDGRCE